MWAIMIGGVLAGLFITLIIGLIGLWLDREFVEFQSGQDIKDQQK